MKFLIILVLLTGVVLAQWSPQGKQPVKRYDFTIITKDKVSLDCTKFIPLTVKPVNGWPVMLYCHGYGDSKETELTTAYDQAQFGYFTLAFSMRGQGKSGGLSNLISIIEMNDLIQVVDYVKKDHFADSSKIVILGASQGGIIPFMATCNGLKVLTVMSDLASPEFASSWIENGSIKMTFFWTVDYDSSIARYDHNVVKLRNWALSNQNSAWDSLAKNLPQGRDFLNKTSQCKVPVLITNAWQDRFFNAEGMIKAASMLKVSFIEYIGAVDGHGSDTSGIENNFSSNMDNNWIMYWLNNSHSHLPDSGVFHYASSHYPKINNRWSFTHFSSPVWPPANYSPIILYFHPQGMLSEQPNDSKEDSSGFRNNIIDSSLTMRQAVNISFKGDLFNSAFKKDILKFETEPLSSDLQITGIPKLNLYYSATSDICQFNAQIWEVTSKGDSDLVTRINYTDRHYIPRQIKNKEINGAAYSHIFFKGDRIKVIFTNLDTQPADSFLVTNPYVLPVLKNGYNTIYYDKDNQSYLELPVLRLPEGIISERKITIDEKGKR